MKRKRPGMGTSQGGKTDVISPERVQPLSYRPKPVDSASKGLFEKKGPKCRFKQILKALTKE